MGHQRKHIDDTQTTYVQNRFEMKEKAATKTKLFSVSIRHHRNAQFVHVDHVKFSNEFFFTPLRLSSCALHDT